MTPLPPATDDLRGASRLAVDAVAGVAALVEELHHGIASLAPIVGAAPAGRPRGITGLVYRSVRGITRAVGFGLDVTLAQLAPLLGARASTPRREAVLAALNGVLGDHLAASGNPLAIAMRLRAGGRPLMLEREALTAACPAATGRVVVLVHGLCMNDLQWQRDGHDHGAALARELQFTPLYLHYNSGLRVSTNGREFATLLERLVDAWPVPVEELVIVGHSMGGLVARSACHAARRARQRWPQRLAKLVFLGTPHHGAALERAGNRVDLLAAISPYTKPFARLGRLRSAGIQDLRHGNLLDADWQARPASHPHDARRHVPLPAGVACFALAATRRAAPGGTGRLPGDGLVSVRSALGQHADPRRALAIPPAQHCICYGLDHFDLLSSRDVYRHLRRWLDRDDATPEQP
jgi:pimeloyl-ACP methyl ester carboxylesterase